MSGLGGPSSQGDTSCQRGGKASRRACVFCDCGIRSRVRADASFGGAWIFIWYARGCNSRV